MITTRRIRITDKKTGDLIQDIPISVMTYICTPTDQKTICIVQLGTSNTFLCHAFKIGKGVTETVVNCLKLACKIRQGKVLPIELEAVFAIPNLTAEIVSQVETTWETRAAGVDKGKQLAEFSGCCYFGTQEIESLDEEDVIDQACEKVAVRGGQTIVTLVIYEKCIEVAEELSSMNDGRYVFQLFPIEALKFAKKIKTGLCLVVGGFAAGNMTCSVFELPLGTSNEQRGMLMNALNTARKGKMVEKSASVDEVTAGFGGADEVEDFGGFGEDANVYDDSDTAYLAPVPVERQKEIDDVYMQLGTVFNAATATTEGGAAATWSGGGEDVYIDIDEDFIAAVNLYLLPTSIGAGPCISTIKADVSKDKGEKKVLCVYIGSVPVNPPFTPPSISMSSVGKSVSVEGYKGTGTLKFWGPHNDTGEVHCGVVYATPIGMNDGSVAGHQYFKCAQGHGVLVKPKKVELKLGLFKTWPDVIKDAVSRLHSARRKTEHQKVSVHVSSKSVKIKRGSDALYSTRPEHVLYFGQFGSGSFLPVVVLDPFDGQLYCRTLTCKGSGSMDSLFSMIETAQVEARAVGAIFPDFTKITPDACEDEYYNYSETSMYGAYHGATGAVSVGRRRSSFAEVASTAEDKDATGTSVEIFEAIYLGSEELPSEYASLRNVSKAKKNDITEESVKRIKEFSDDCKTAAVIDIRSEGIKARAALTEEVLVGCTLHDLRHSSCFGAKSEVFAILQKNTTNGVTQCHAFQCATKEALPIADALARAYMANQMKASTDPFKGVGGRLNAPKNLFRRQVHRADLTALNPIGAGQFGQVYLADEVTEGKSHKRAVKMLRTGASTADRNEFVHEAEVMLKMKGHPNIVEMAGCCIQQAPWLLVLEYLPFGDLRSVLKACKNKAIELLEMEQLALLADCAAGMEFMEVAKLIHCDLAARNVLIGERNVCKIADFGMTVELEKGAETITGAEGAMIPVKWCAIEILTNRTFSAATDVWAFGVLMWEVFAYGAMPYPGVPTRQISRKLMEGVRLSAPHGCSEPVYGMMKSCWNSHASSRPKFRSVKSELKSHLRALPMGMPRELGLILQDDFGAGAADQDDEEGEVPVVTAGENSYEYMLAAAVIKKSTKKPAMEGTADGAKKKKKKKATSGGTGTRKQKKKGTGKGTKAARGWISMEAYFAEQAQEFSSTKGSHGEEVSLVTSGPKSPVIDEDASFEDVIDRLMGL
jgi:serine/threonine protein kinase